MGRAQVPIKFIECPKSRNKTFLKRIKGLTKKTYEFATLCGVDVCMICLEPQGEQQHKPQIWPEDPQEIRRVIKRYKGTGNKENDKQKLNLLDFSKERSMKLEDKLSRKSRKRADVQYPSLDNQLKSLSEELLQTVMVRCDSKIETVNKKIESSQEMKMSVEIAPQTNPYHMQEMCVMDLMPIQSLPISVTKPSDVYHMGMEQLDYSYRQTYANNEALQLPAEPSEGCFGNSGIGMLNKDNILCIKKESCDAEAWYGNPAIGMLNNNNIFYSVEESCDANPEIGMMNSNTTFYSRKELCNAEGYYGNPGSGMFNNDGAFHSQKELFDGDGCYGDPGIRMLYDDDKIFYSQTESWDDNYFQSFLQSHSSFIELPSPSSNSNLTTYVNGISTSTHDPTPELFGIL